MRIQEERIQETINLLREMQASYDMSSDEDQQSFEKSVALDMAIESLEQFKPKKKVPRISTINTVEELIDARDEFERYCCDNTIRCKECNLHDTKFRPCFVGWLCEEIEEEE